MHSAVVRLAGIRRAPWRALHASWPRAAEDVVAAEPASRAWQRYHARRAAIADAADLWARTEAARATGALAAPYGDVDRPRDRPRGERLLELLAPLRHFGAGAKVRRVTWTSADSYWIVRKIKWKKPGHGPRGGLERARYGKVWGVKVWRGERRSGTLQRVPGRYKGMWLSLIHI